MTQPSMSHSGYLTDYWTTEDYLSFEDFRPALEKIITQAQTPITVGVFGPWGSGKTSLLKMLQKHIEENGQSGWRTVWFTAWKYDQREALWRALILRVIDALYPQSGGKRLAYDELTLKQQALVDELDRLQESVYRPLDWQELGKLTVDWAQMLKEGGKAEAEIAAAFIPGAGVFKKLVDVLGGDGDAGQELDAAAGAFRREVRSYHREQLRFLEQFEDAFQKVLQMALGEDGRLIVFVDDLDRCLPEQAVEVLEAIKLFLEVAGTVFVLGMDQSVVERGVEAHYGNLFKKAGLTRSELPIRGDSYLQKIVQIPFHLPSLAADDLAKFIRKLDEGSDEVAAYERLSQVTREVFARGLYPNPRQVKRAINIFRLLKTIAETRQANGSLPEKSVAWPLLAKTVVIQTQYPKLYQDWRRYPTLVQQLEDAYEAQPTDEDEIIVGKVLASEETESRQRRSGGLLEPYLSNRSEYVFLEKMLRYPPADQSGGGDKRARFKGLKPEEMAVYTRLAGAVEAEMPVEAVSEIPEDILSGDVAKVKDAVARIDEKDYEKWRPALLGILQSSQRPVQERFSAGTALSVLGDPRDFNELVTVPAGEFLMGSTMEQVEEIKKQVTKKYYKWYEAEKPQHKVFVGAFRISKYPVTNAQYAEFVKATVREPPKHWRGEEPPPELRNHPVVNVSWFDAIAYCNWLAQETRVPYRLPTEAEWEKAARGTDARIYPWGNNFSPEKCNVAETGIWGTSPVGMFPDGASPYGCLDMSGNVWEWTLSKYKKYPYRPDDGGEEIDVSDERRVVHGGSFNFDHQYARCAFRINYNSHYSSYFIGFRVVVPGS